MKIQIHCLRFTVPAIGVVFDEKVTAGVGPNVN